jgi:hypothetical protein
VRSSRARKRPLKRRKRLAQAAFALVIVPLASQVPFWQAATDPNTPPVFIWANFVIALAVAWVAVAVAYNPEREPASPLLCFIVCLLEVISLYASLYYWFKLHGAFHGMNTPLDAVYFSVTTLTTTGYGDIYPTRNITKILVMTQMLTDLALLAVAAAILIPRPRRRDDQDQLVLDLDI